MCYYYFVCFLVNVLLILCLFVCLFSQNFGFVIFNSADPVEQILGNRVSASIDSC